MIQQDRNVKVNVVGAAINMFMTLSSSKIWDDTRMILQDRNVKGAVTHLIMMLSSSRICNSSMLEDPEKSQPQGF